MDSNPVQLGGSNWYARGAAKAPALWKRPDFRRAEARKPWRRRPPAPNAAPAGASGGRDLLGGVRNRTRLREPAVPSAARETT